jgi:hypothetical protein
MLADSLDCMYVRTYESPMEGLAVARERAGTFKKMGLAARLSMRLS